MAAAPISGSIPEPIPEPIPDGSADWLGAGPHRLHIGLKPMSEDGWVSDQDDFVQQLRERQAIIDQHDDVLASLPGSERAEQELLNLLFDYLPARLPQHYSLAPDGLMVRPTGRVWARETGLVLPIEVVARIVPDDFCLMQADARGIYRLTAAALCFPTRWRLGLKMGQDLTRIHDPVPGYEARLGRGVERVFESLKVERPMWRSNWSVVDSPALYQPVRSIELNGELNGKLSGGGDGAVDAVQFDPDRIGQRLWLRSERQTIRRLPITQCVVFSIRIRQARLSHACAEGPQCPRSILEQLDTMSAEMKRYKALDDVEPMLRRYLNQVLEGNAPKRLG